MTPDRFFSLMLLLESRDAVTTTDLAAALGVSLRTVTRDLNWLREAGFPVSAQRGRSGGVTVLPGTGLDLTRLTPGERQTLSLTGLDEKQREDLNASTETRHALAKLSKTHPGHSEDLIPLTEVVHVDSRPWLQPRPDGIPPAALIGPVRRARQLRIEYNSSREAQPSTLVVDPYGLLAKAGIWYLVADCDRAPRMFRLERITAWAETGHRRRIRPRRTLHSVAATLTAQWEHDHVIEVSATIDESQVERALRIFGQRLRLEKHTDETAAYKVTIRFPHLEDVRALLPFGRSITVHEPAEAKARLHDLATELADHHRPS
ncbi:putative DNA-binding transcriptional regulator YafY [Lipingzhangella halophila]|uniref:Putative DNA-binding transcriptional regulator YafY n=1 Tax=Lipingzhangella halophila TaxID=1783352 RepID=A0A7W7RHW2_9ACTN|nr:WYL domain-containing protein [Lipingzhangella halophila]MBB4932254.1 putative DNA-binding transcriptional regulator YafY [Lipingzhangella halophila]